MLAKAYPVAPEELQSPKQKRVSSTGGFGSNKSGERARKLQDRNDLLVRRGVLQISIGYEHMNLQVQRSILSFYEIISVCLFPPFLI